VGHACLKVAHGDTELLTDPWIDGPAYSDQWYHYPLPDRCARGAGTGREVDLPLGLADELRAHKARCRQSGPSERVFVNRSGRPQTIRNVEARIKTAISKANERLDELGIEPLSERVTPPLAAADLREPPVREGRRFSPGRRAARTH
jgi:hypothetical protein